MLFAQGFSVTEIAALLSATRSTVESWRNRDKWQQYSDAVGDMVDRTSSEIASWTLVEANDKRFARVKVLRTINDALEKAFAED